MDFIILVSTTLLLYAFLRSHGGEGVSIKAQAAPLSAPEGKRDRAIAFVLVAMTVAAIVNMFISEEWNDRPLTIIAPLIMSTAVFTFFYLNKDKKE